MAGHGSMVMIAGEPGIGETHLITAILEEARRRGVYANIVPFPEMLEHTARALRRRRGYGVPSAMQRRK